MHVRRFLEESKKLSSGAAHWEGCAQSAYCVYGWENARWDVRVGKETRQMCVARRRQSVSSDLNKPPGMKESSDVLPL